MPMSQLSNTKSMIDFETSNNLIQLELDKVRTIMRDSIYCSNPALQTCINELLSNPGKMLRPKMTILSACSVLQTRKSASLGNFFQTNDKVLRLAAAIEIMHMATLVHDDVIDGATVRRNRPSVFASHGARIAILLGDLLFSAAFQLVADLADAQYSAKLSKAVRTISDSEILQMNRIDPEQPSLRQYIHQVIGKTAVLFALSCRAGAEIVGANALEIQALQRAGYNLGMAFQIMDDIMDFDADESQSGKTPGRDLQLGLLTLPVLATLKKMKAIGKVDSQLLFSLRKSTPSISDIKEIRNLIQDWGGFAESALWVKRYTERAIRELSTLAETEARSVLNVLALELTQRTA